MPATYISRGWWRPWAARSPGSAPRAASVSLVRQFSLLTGPPLWALAAEVATLSAVVAGVILPLGSHVAPFTPTSPAASRLRRVIPTLPAASRLALGPFGHLKISPRVMQPAFAVRELQPAPLGVSRHPRRASTQVRALGGPIPGAWGFPRSGI